MLGAARWLLPFGWQLPSAGGAPQVWYCLVIYAGMKLAH